MTPPLAIIQARLHSERLPRKMLLALNRKPLLQWAWERTVEHFGRGNAVIAVPMGDLGALCPFAPSAWFAGFDGEEWDVLGRFHEVAHRFRALPSDRIHRITPDDFPVELEREVFTLAELDHAQQTIAPDDHYRREHIAFALFGHAPTVGPDVIEINTLEDYEAAKRKVGDV